MPCKNTKMVGRDVVMEYVIGCNDTLPAETDWKRIGSARTKEWSAEWDSTDATDDESVGNLRENLATFLGLTMSIDGTVKVNGPGSENLIELTKHILNPEATSGQPFVWMRQTFADITITAYMMVSSIGRSSPYDDIVTYSLEASATSSPFGLIVEDTPDPDAPDATSVQVIPATFSLPAGNSFNVEAIALPVGASQSMRWTSSAPQFATVNPVSGIVTAVAAGTATITATSDTAGVVGTSTVTVLPIVTGIVVNPTAVSVAVGEDEALTASVSPSGAQPGLVYMSGNTNIATVSNVGLVTGVAPGTTSIKITSASRPSVVQNVPVTVTA